MLLISSPLFPYAPPQNCNASPFLLLRLLFPSERSPSSSKAARAGGLRLSLIWRARPTVRGSDPGWASLPPRNFTFSILLRARSLLLLPGFRPPVRRRSNFRAFFFFSLSRPFACIAPLRRRRRLRRGWRRLLMGKKREREKERCPSPSLLPHSVQMVPLGVLPLLRPNDQWE